MVVQFKLTKTEYKPENIIQNEVTIIDKLSLPDAADASRTPLQDRYSWRRHCGGREAHTAVATYVSSLTPRYELVLVDKYGRRTVTSWSNSRQSVNENCCHQIANWC